MSFYEMVPRVVSENLLYRRRILEMALGDEGYARELWIMCSRDLLFFVNSFIYLYEPRDGSVPPFVTYPYQDETLLRIDASIGSHDLLIEKSRDTNTN